MSDDFFAPPPFDPAAARATLARTLRDLALTEREGVFEWNRQPAVRVEADGPLLRIALARRPARSPDWDPSEVRDHAQLRKVVDELKKRVARWGDARDAD